jgi:hypothetical protein
VRILITGSRDWRKPEIIKQALLPYNNFSEYGNVQLIHGNARGVDKIGAIYAKQFGWDVTAVDADWEIHGKAAGPIRNRKMLDMCPHVVLGFPSTAHGYSVTLEGEKPRGGTWDCLYEAAARKIPTVYYLVFPEETHVVEIMP